MEFNLFELRIFSCYYIKMKSNEIFSLIDTGGTYTKAQILKVFKGNIKILLEKVEKISSKTEFFKFLSKFKEFSPFEISVFSFAGPIFKDSCKMTNWEGNQSFKLSEIKKQINSKEAYMLNDMEAQGYGLLKIIEKISKDINIKKLYIPKEAVKNENMVLIVPGTGLGSCAIIEGKIIHSLELQHSSFFPKDNRIRGVFLKLIEKGIYPSYESIVSGEGISSVYSILKGKKDLIIDPEKVRSKAINKEKFAMETFEIYFYVLSLYCQAVALAFKPLKGIYIGGKAVEKNIRFLNKKKFIKIFMDNPKQKDFLEKISLFLIEKNLIFDGLFYFLNNIRCGKILKN